MSYKNTPWSKTQYYRRLKRADALGCSIFSVPDGRGRHGNHAKGQRNARWNGGRWEHSDGYVGIAVPIGHHLRQAHGYAYEHQIVAEKMLKRRLRSDEVVHHKNGKRADNRPANLDVTTRSDHARHHVSRPSARDERGRFNNAPRH